MHRSITDGKAALHAMRWFRVLALALATLAQVPVNAQPAQVRHQMWMSQNSLGCAVRRVGDPSSDKDLRGYRVLQPSQGPAKKVCQRIDALRVVGACRFVDRQSLDLCKRADVEVRPVFELIQDWNRFERDQGRVVLRLQVQAANVSRALMGRDLLPGAAVETKSVIHNPPRGNDPAPPPLDCKNSRLLDARTFGVLPIGQLSDAENLEPNCSAVRIRIGQTDFLLTAKHCVNDGNLWVEQVGGTFRKLVCHEAKSSDGSPVDLAFCPFTASPADVVETLDPGSVGEGDPAKVLMAGWGPRDPECIKQAEREPHLNGGISSLTGGKIKAEPGELVAMRGDSGGAVFRLGSGSSRQLLGIIKWLPSDLGSKETFYEDVRRSLCESAPIGSVPPYGSKPPLCRQ